jgi:cytochrome c-type biogenesis protein CcmH/NrfG
MRGKRLVALLLVALAAYLSLIGSQGASLIAGHSVVVVALGAAVLALCGIGAWLVAAEVRFGLATERLARRLDAEGEPDEVPLPRTPSGRVPRAAADELFLRRRAEVEQDPDDWRGWYRLALAYDYAGDRRRARAAMRVAIERAGTERAARA